MARYAAQTAVGVDRSKAEIERTLMRWGADAFMYGQGDGMVQIGFRMRGRKIQMRVAMPKLEEFRYTPARRTYRSDREALAAWDQGCKQRWRALALIIKAKLEAVESGITTFEDEFLVHTLLPDGRTAGEWLGPQIEEAYESGRMPMALPGLALPPPS
jgi:hypothetical protein